MIACIEGNIIAKDNSSLIVNVGGLGYRVFVTNELLADTLLGQSIKLMTHLVVKEDSQTLYGFLANEDLGLFTLLISVSGIGPKIAIAILSSSKTSELRTAISHGDSAIFTAISGVGLKTAQRLILELRSKIGAVDLDGGISDSEDVISAMTSLGYNMYEIRKVIGKVPANLPLNDKVKEALKLLG
ncbi:Holliday junction branch migration protein RuvA [Patescibacteria group bacterium]|nr:Holliday junction branch migration protein RuvA [Patescibacteria group bacterium]